MFLFETDLLGILHNHYSRSDNFMDLSGDANAIPEESIYVQAYCDLAKHNLFLVRG